MPIAAALHAMLQDIADSGPDIWALTLDAARGAPASAAGWTLRSVMLLLGSAGAGSAVALPAVTASVPPLDLGAGMGMLCSGIESSARAGSGPAGKRQQRSEHHESCSASSTGPVARACLAAGSSDVM